jgi:hypothetical protein
MDYNRSKVDKEPFIVIGQGFSVKPVKAEALGLIVNEALEASQMGRARGRGYDESIGPASLYAEVEDDYVLTVVQGEGFRN